MQFPGFCFVTYGFIQKKKKKNVLSHWIDVLKRLKSSELPEAIAWKIYYFKNHLYVLMRKMLKYIICSRSISAKPRQ